MFQDREGFTEAFNFGARAVRPGVVGRESRGPCRALLGTAGILKTASPLDEDVGNDAGGLFCFFGQGLDEDAELTEGFGSSEGGPSVEGEQD